MTEYTFAYGELDFKKSKLYLNTKWSCKTWI